MKIHFDPKLKVVADFIKFPIRNFARHVAHSHHATMTVWACALVNNRRKTLSLQKLK